MRHAAALAIAAGLAAVTVRLDAQAQLLQHGRATFEYRSREVNAVVSYDYSQRNHAGAWLLLHFAVQARERIAVERSEIDLLTGSEDVIALATQQQFLEDHQELSRLLQNAQIWRRPLGMYFVSPVTDAIQFFSPPGRIVHDSFVTNRDNVAEGDLFFKSPTGTWPAGTYQLRLEHDQARAVLPIELQ
jgi:hypothetical protein